MLAASENELVFCQVCGIKRGKRGLQRKDCPESLQYHRVKINMPPQKIQLIVFVTWLPLNCTFQ